MSKDATTSVGGARVPADGPVLMVFEQSAAAGPWQLASVAQFPSGTTLPSLATDKNGYVPQVPLTSTDLLAQPYATGPLQAAVVDDGPASAAAKAVAAGPLTTGLYQAARDRADNDLEVPARRRLPVVDGGHAVPRVRAPHGRRRRPRPVRDVPELHGRRPRLLRRRQPDPARRPIKVPQDLLPLLPSGQPSPRVKLAAQTLFSFAAIDPPATSSKITVLAIGGGLNYATAS